MKIVLIGAGSRCFGRGQIADILQEKALCGRNTELHLVDVDARALDTIVRVSHEIRRHTGSDVAIHATTDRTQALPGADYVFLAVARKRLEFWEQDFRVPLAHGFRQCLGENGGPGAVLHTLRSLHLILPICRDIERLCPHALVFNFSNPEARVLHAIHTLTRVRAIGICHGVFSALKAIERYLERSLEDLDIVSAGLNHFYCIVKAKDRRTGHDYLPELVRKATTDTAHPLFRKMAEIFGVFSFPSDDHIGEYLSYGTEYHGVKWLHGLECRKVDAPLRPKFALNLEDYASGQKAVDRWLLRPSGEVAVPIITDLTLGRACRRPAVDVPNTEGFISNLPTNAIVEVPADIDGRGIHPVHVGDIPEGFAAAMRTQCTIQALLTEAYRTGSRQLLLQALLLDPVVNSIEQSEAMLDAMLKLQEDYLPPFQAENQVRGGAV